MENSKKGTTRGGVDPISKRSRARARARGIPKSYASCTSSSRSSAFSFLCDNLILAIFRFADLLLGLCSRWK